MQGSFPVVVLFLAAGNFLYVRTSYSSEFYLRRDFIRLLKQKKEEAHTRAFLNNMLPEVCCIPRAVVVVNA